MIATTLQRHGYLMKVLHNTLRQTVQKVWGTKGDKYKKNWMVENNWISRAEKNLKPSITEDPRNANKGLLLNSWDLRDTYIVPLWLFDPYTFLNFVYLKFKRVAETKLWNAHVESSTLLNLSSVHYRSFVPVSCNALNLFSMFRLCWV